MTLLPFRTPRTSRLAGVLASAAVVAVMLSACASGSEGSGSGSPGERSGDGTNGAFPRTVQTGKGPVTIEGAPDRVVALSPTNADELLALGMEPVAVAADPTVLHDEAPWIADEIEDLAHDDFHTAGGDLNVEAIAAVEPDLIVAQTYQVADDAVYQQLSAIAPTVTPDSQDGNVDWDVRLRAVAEAVDQADEAARIIADIEEQFAAAGEQIPGIDGKTYQWIRVDPDAFAFGNASVFDLFGMRPAGNQDNTMNTDPLSLERIGELDADFLAVWAPTPELRERIDQDPLFQDLPAVRNGTVYYADLAFATAINSPAPAALEWLKDSIVPALDELAD